MTVAIHPAAPHHLPFFIPGPDGSDPLLVGTGIFLIVAVVAFGLIFLRLHTLPERMAHRGHKLQFEIVAVLGLLALFTHIHAFWVAGLLLALIDIPDFTGPMRRIAGSTERMAGLPPGGGDTAENAATGPFHAAEHPQGPTPPDAVPERARTRVAEHHEA
ncbi:hypothetical protein [Falsiroseomonas oryziterrae]|uniref:hypothetical protein n=1 Tax=Falsiroseomonas oryziterrae TaxID=2911368 RepID=UPI001F3338E9|nr:hypothetical protein [Roseomonas sp. NPKOSM-4]